MKALIPFAYYYPETCAGISVVDDMMRRLAAEGNVCVIYVPTPTRNVKSGSEWCRDEYLCGGRIHIHRFKMFEEGRNPVMRAVRYVLCECYYLHRMLWDDYDVAFIDSTPPIQGLKNPLIKLIRRKPVVYNAQDIFPDSLVGASLVQKGGLLWKIGRLVEVITYKYADKIIVISEDFKNNLIAKGVPEEKVVVVYNWVNQNAVSSVDRAENKLIKAYGIDPKKFHIEYAGNIGLTQNMDMLLEVMKELKQSNPEIGLILVGEGVYKKHVEEIVARDELTNVTMLPFQPYEDISHVFSLGDVGLVISKPGVGANSVPSKTWSIMSASRPVLASFDPNELKDILEGTHPFSVDGGRCGIFTEAGDKEAFKRAILEMYGNPDLCKEMGARGREYILKNLTKEVGTRKYVEVIKSVCESTRKA